MVVIRWPTKNEDPTFHLALGDLASSCGMWLVPADSLAPSQTARSVSGDAEASMFDRRTRAHGLALQVPSLA
jgi:hypothetical protein